MNFNCLLLHFLKSKRLTRCMLHVLNPSKRCWKWSGAGPGLPVCCVDARSIKCEPGPEKTRNNASHAPGHVITLCQSEASISHAPGYAHCEVLVRLRAPGFRRAIASLARAGGGGSQLHWCENEMLGHRY